MGKEWDSLKGWRTIENMGKRTGTFGGYAKRTTPRFDTQITYGQKQQLWHTQWLTEVYRVLKPGGSMLVMGGTRTSHRLACAIEDSGFIIKDTILWLFGSGFPKCQDITPMIDGKILGITTKQVKERRRVIGTKRHSDNFDNAKTNKVGYLADPANKNNEKCFGYGIENITIPLTPEAKHWDGFKVGGIKPAYEPIIWAVKPPEGSYVDNVLKWGIGAVNVPETRINSPKGNGVWGTSNKTINPDRKFNASPDMHDYKSEQNQRGRFPANVILSHHPECVQVGMKRVKSPGGNGITTAKSHFQRGEIKSGNFYADKDGLETVESWDCMKGGITETELIIFDGLKATPFDSISSLLKMMHHIVSHLSKLSDIPYSHIEDKYNLQDYENFGETVGLSKLPSFRVCCQSCCHFYDELAHKILKVAQLSSQQLSDVQKTVFHFLYLHAHNHEMLYSDHLSNYDDFFQFEPYQDTELNKLFEALPSCELLAERSFYKQGISGEDLKNAYNSNNKDENKKPVFSDKHKILFDNTCIDALCRRLFVLFYKVVSWYLPITIIPYSIELSNCAVRLLDDQSGILKSHGGGQSSFGGMFGNKKPAAKTFTSSGGASRFFYCAKSSRGERNAGLEGMEENSRTVRWKGAKGDNWNNIEMTTKNNHPTVKPIKLFEWLIKLVTREGQIVLDPFIGSGTTAIAAHNVGRKCIGIEKEDEYLEIAKRRIDYWKNQSKQMEIRT